MKMTNMVRTGVLCSFCISLNKIRTQLACNQSNHVVSLTALFLVRGLGSNGIGINNNGINHSSIAASLLIRLCLFAEACNRLAHRMPKFVYCMNSSLRADCSCQPDHASHSLHLNTRQHANWCYTLKRTEARTAKEGKSATQSKTTNTNPNCRQPTSPPSHNVNAVSGIHCNAKPEESLANDGTAPLLVCQPPTECRVTNGKTSGATQACRCYN